jgi:hypothetical protein
VIMNGKVLAACAALLACSAFAAKPGTCNDIPVQWTVDTGQGLSGDGLPYVDGNDRIAAVLLICGSKDVTLNLNNSSRRVQYSWPAQPLVQNSNTPPWASGAAIFWSKAFLNVRKVLGNIALTNNQLPSSDYVLTTTLGGTFTGPDGGQYNHRWVNTTAPLAGTLEHVGPGQDASWLNTPYMTSKVRVEYTAATRTWVVTPDETEFFSGPSGTAANVMTLIFSKGRTSYNAGQFSGLKFRFVITVK